MTAVGERPVPYPVGCASNCGTTIDLDHAKVDDAIQTMKFKGWAWFSAVGWVCPDCQDGRP